MIEDEQLATYVKFTPNEITIDVGSYNEAENLAIAYECKLAYWASLFGKSQIILRCTDHQLEIPASFIVQNTQIMVDNKLNTEATSNTLLFGNDLKISLNLLKVAQELLENPRSAGIVNLKTERTIIMHDQATCTLRTTTPGQATNRTRGQYWHPQDLIDFRRYCRQEMPPGTTAEFNYRTFEPELGIYDPTPGNWMEMRTRYRTLEIDGQFYQISENLEYKEMQEVPTF